MALVAATRSDGQTITVETDLTHQRAAEICHSMHWSDFAVNCAKAWDTFGAFSRLNNWMIITAQTFLNRQESLVFVKPIIIFFKYQAPNYRHYIIHDIAVENYFLRLKSSTSSDRVHLIRGGTVDETYLTTIREDGGVFTDRLTQPEIDALITFSEAPIETGIAW